MSYASDREQFLVTMSAEGLPIYVGRKILAMANRLQVISELSCSSEAADRDRVPCPGVKREKDCCCDQYDCGCGHSVRCHGVETIGGCSECTCAKFAPVHSDIPRIDRQEWRIKRNLDALLVEREGFKANYQGDPRGAVVKIAVPSGKYDDMSREGICVPAKGLPVSFWEHNR